MSNKYPSRTMSAAQRGVTTKNQAPPARISSEILAKQDPSACITITALDLPEGLRALLYMDGQYMCIQYTDLEQYFATPTDPNPPTSSAETQQIPLATQAAVPGVQLSTKRKPSLFIDITAQTPAKPPLPSINILPYIRLYLTVRNVRFHFMTPNDAQGHGLTDLASEVIYKYAQAWRDHVLNSGFVKEVRIWWREKCLDIMLKPDSDWAIDWEIHAEDVHVLALKSALGLSGKRRGQWRGDVVVESVEGERV